MFRHLPMLVPKCEYAQVRVRPSASMPKCEYALCPSAKWAWCTLPNLSSLPLTCPGTPPSVAAQPTQCSGVTSQHTIVCPKPNPHTHRILSVRPCLWIVRGRGNRVVI
eukprot:CAMPEP_0174703624 /NCGR_PEP_ID=MMETSP1094-20130205/7506_1 /TAXON_ID=156173 /ORGANISM="Chrysochromulina brevifilum, Strain UTEX LB 985" /LENGTH=107 /DNA_ID=CAMNT_0015901569 /DNA_START=239 /DNA_END=562 /DNA_ORIENTATION=-